MSELIRFEWPEIGLKHGLSMDSRIAPNALVRSAVFSTQEYQGKGRPLITTPLPLATIKPYTIEQVAGPRLSQSDADLFFLLLSNLYRTGAPTGPTDLYVRRNEVYAALGRSRGGKSDLLLHESLQRLCSAELKYDVLGSRNQTTLLSRCDRLDDDNKLYHYRARIASAVAPLLEAGEWLLLQGKVRKQLAADPLAVGLHAFYASHQHAYPMLTATLKALMGRESMQESKWQGALAVSLGRVQAATGWLKCGIASSGTYAGKVVVQTGVVRRRKPQPPEVST